MQDGIFNSVIEAIGETPLVELSRITRNLDGRVLAKLEYLNPGYSKKDRVARQVIADAEAEGTLSPGQSVVELTSGNTGTGLAIVCRIRGYPFVAVMSKGNSVERARMMIALGAEVVLVDQLRDSEPGKVSGRDLELVEQAAQKIVRERNAFRADQFQLQGNFRAHYLHTGPEILRQSKNQVEAFCDFVGTGGTFGGCAAAFKQANPQTKCFVIEPDEAAVLAGRAVRNPNHRIQGGGYSIPELQFVKRAFVDGFLSVTEEQAIQAARRMAKDEGIFAGFSSGANLAGALQLLQGPCKGKTVAIVICDSGLKYLSTDLWTQEAAAKSG